MLSRREKFDVPSHSGFIFETLIHHILVACGFVPEGMIFPVSALMLKQPRRYDRMLESYSRELMRHIEYRLNANGEMSVTHATASFFRYIDLTFIAEELFRLVEETVGTELVAETCTAPYRIPWANIWE